MKNRIMPIILLFSYTHLYAVSSQEVDVVEKSINHLDKVVNDHYSVIKANRIESVDTVLGRYRGSKSSLLKKWFFIVTQSYNDPSIKRFIEESKPMMKFYLEQMLLDSKNPISQKDYNLVSKKFMSLIGSNENRSLDYNYITTTGVNVRSLPIFYSLTKQVVLKKKSLLKLSYIIIYRTEDGKISNWGYIKVKETGQRGWVNLKNTRRVK
ncbi:MAG TPA: hypothetical protein ENK88_03645 [Campylobacterales bacterium]|nr:hypothetical protein [Campylobacterales bacterium]